MKEKFPYIVFLLLLVGCSPTKYIPEGQYFLEKVKVKMDDSGVDPAIIESYIQQKPNSSKFGVHIYNMVDNDSNFIKKFIRKIGEAPVIYNPNSVPLSVDEIATEMKNLGYLNSAVTSQVDTANKKATVIYDIHNGEPYRIRNYTQEISQLQPRTGNRQRNQQGNRRSIGERSRAITAAFTAQNAPKIKEGSIFNLDVLEEERQRVTTQMRNRGYYQFPETNLHYLADTTLQSNQVDLKLILLDSTAIFPYTVKRVNVYSGYDPLETYTIKDSLEYDSIHIYYNSPKFLRRRIIREKVRVQPNRQYRERSGERTVSLFQDMSCVERVDLQYIQNNYPDSTLLDCNIYLTPGNFHSLQGRLVGTNKAGDIGVALDGTYGNLNIFNGSETFSVNLRGAYEFVSGTSVDGLGSNYYELGVSPALTFPTMQLPLIQNYVAERFNAQTQYSLGLNVQRRPEYIRNFFNFNWKVSWAAQNSPLSQSLSIVDINYVYMPYKSGKFIEYLDSIVDPLTKTSYDNVFTAGINYSAIYTNANVGGLRQNLYTIRFNTELSGNILDWICHATNASRSADGKYTIFGNSFAQYAKANIDFAETFQLTPTAGLAFHFGAGVAYPYGNSEILPFEKRYYGGGPNNVRGWNTRYLGPGSFSGGKKDDPTTHVGDISLVASAEYRFKALPWLEPAFFVDAGNIWTIKDYPDQPGGLFKWNNFFKEIALGTGIGLRFDLTFLVVRVDAGTKVHDPARASGDRLVLFKENLLKNSAVYFAIGYPF
ncbi:MAG: BamA/TamA family outer membrane protein [Candidatus Symbiothrix sp.]|jgi:outer membrane protein assembly factor BamA|nr:BamA/TamA family outer membrane protein [Candidatus Symbiothrix sp.]